MIFYTTSSLVLPLSLYLLSTTSIYLRNLERRDGELNNRNQNISNGSNNPKLDLSDPSSDIIQKLTGSSDTGMLNGLTSLLKLSPNSQPQNNADIKSDKSSENTQTGLLSSFLNSKSKANSDTSNSDSKQKLASSSNTSFDPASTQSSGGLLNLVGISSGSNDSDKSSSGNNGIVGSNAGLLGLLTGDRSSRDATISENKKLSGSSDSIENNPSSNSRDNFILVFPDERQEGGNNKVRNISSGGNGSNPEDGNSSSNNSNESIKDGIENDENSSSDINDSSINPDDSNSSDDNSSSSNSPESITDDIENGENSSSDRKNSSINPSDKLNTDVDEEVITDVDSFSTS